MPTPASSSTRRGSFGDARRARGRAALVAPKRAPERAVRTPRGADDARRPPRHQHGPVIPICGATDLPHRHLFDSALQRRRVSNRSPGCGRQQPHRTKIRDLRRVDDHRQRPDDEHPVRIQITGVFDLPNLQSAYWFGDGAAYFAFGQNTGIPLFLHEARRSVRGQPRRLCAPPRLRALAHHPERVAARGAGHRECVGGHAGHARPGAARRGRRLRGRNRSPSAALRAPSISRA